MKHISYFDKFLKEKVNLNQSRLDTLDSKVEIITNLLKSKLPNYRKYSKQGSFAHHTIIKPVKDNDEFDADILVFIKDDDFNPDEFNEDYISTIYHVFHDNGNYKNIVRRKSRCVTIDYSGDFHLDAVPCIEHEDEFYICNRKEKKYEKTDGDGYKKWLADKNRITGGNNLKKTTRLLKYLRDHKSNYSIASVLLTTILGNQISAFYENSDEFKDLPQALKTLSNRVNNYLQSNPSMPTISNPVLPEENFTRKWDSKKYRNFRNKFDLYNRKINQAFEAKDHNKSVKKWREIFGDEFGELKDSSASSQAARGVMLGSIVSSPHAIATKPYSKDD